MSATHQKPTPANIKISSGSRHQRESALCLDRSVVWYDSDSNSGEDRGEDGEEMEGGRDDVGEEEDEGGEDADSTDSGESSDSISTPESSPPANRHALLHGQDDGPATAVGAFDADGNWVWSRVRSKNDSDDRTAAHVQPVLNRHDRAQMAMTGSLVPRASDVFWTSSSGLDAAGLGDQDDDPFDVVGFTSYQPRTRTSSSTREGHSIVLPVRIRLEDDSSSDESESSTLTSSGSDTEARRRASMHMLQRLGRIAIPARRASVRLGHGAPRRPPSLDEISSRVVSGCSSAYARSTPPGSAVPQQRAASCPSPQHAWFSEVQVLVTPPTPQLPAEKIRGVVLRSANVPACPYATDARGRLAAPAFDVAPGRHIMLAEREHQAKLWLEAFKQQQQQRLNLNVGAGGAAPPMANEAQAEATFTPSCPTRAMLSNCADARDGAPTIPPRRRSFVRRVSGQLQPAHAAAPVSRSASEEVGERARSEGSGGTRGSDALPAPAPNRRSLVARLSLRRSSREISKAQGAVLAPRRPAPAALA
ncbi:conserved hypothetical protein [Sporisorium reilianum SRZ2]|uniref:Uncharacterized protein n=1 Tax=Sporisorium reilianum (strain SRZ2) TaxID=999809 RepID=E6ZLJ4_SPORE|nr:conserved hypothetical protein [Sporisorium reilianum SRZ2]